MDDCFDQFIELYGKGDISALVKMMLPDSDAAYEALQSQSKFFPFVVNYIDAAIFGSSSEALYCNRLLCFLFQSEASGAYEKILARLKFEQNLLNSLATGKNDPSLTEPFARLLEMERTEELITPEEAKRLADRTDPDYRNLFENQCVLSQSWLTFKKNKPDFAMFCVGTRIRFFRPFYPMHENNAAFGLTQAQNPLLFIFKTISDLLHALQFPLALDTLSDPKHMLYILELYPNGQLLSQNYHKRSAKHFQPVILSQNQSVKNAAPQLLKALQACCAQSEEELQSDSECADRLYHKAKQLLFCLREEQLGMGRAPALFERFISDNWNDPHKGVIEDDTEWNLLSKDYFGKKLAQLAFKRLFIKKKIRIVHVTAQVIDAMHAPSRLLESLIRHHDPEQFEPFLICTERSQLHLREYPYPQYISDPSSIRGKERLERFRKQKIDVRILDPYNSYEQTANSISAILHQVAADIVVFHGPDVINYMVAQQTNVPLRVLFEHGTPPSYPGFDLMIASTSAAADIYGETCAKIGTKIRMLPFRLDIRATWLPEPDQNELPILPRDSLCMTTISNHLQTRLSKDMCLAIVEILTKIPNAYYLPIGPVSETGKKELMDFFRHQQVADRVIFLGNVGNPSQRARSMHIYLNEFPFGSCIGMLEAMAGGCPAVSMYDPHGPPQGRYGGEFMGLDKVVLSGQREEYVELACNLLSNSEMYHAWSEHAKAQYEKHADEKKYVKDFEKILMEHLLLSTAIS